MSNLQRTIENHKHIASMLSHPIVKRLGAKNPDATWDVYGSTVSGNINIWVEENDNVDISELENIECDGNYYSLAKELYFRETKARGKSLKIRLRLNVNQPLKDDERDLLRSIGKLQTHRSESTYESLTCS